MTITDKDSAVVHLSYHTTEDFARDLRKNLQKMWYGFCRLCRLCSIAKKFSRRLDRQAFVCYNVLIEPVQSVQRRESVEIIISGNSSKPIYTQITEQLKAQIMDGTLHAGESLPSMRSLAKSLHVSVITVQRAYEELQRDGFLETTVGRGSFVAAQNPEIYREEQQRKAEEHLLAAAEIARVSGISLGSLVQALTIFYREEE